MINLRNSINSNFANGYVFDLLSNFQKFMISFTSPSISFQVLTNFSHPPYPKYRISLKCLKLYDLWGIESISVIILSMNELSSSETPLQEICQDSTHTFILRSVEGTQRAIEDVELNLPRAAVSPKDPAIVVFNQDHKPYTPAFLSCAQQAQLGSLDGDYKTIFESKVRHSRGIHLADPRKTKSGQNPYYLSPSSDYCLICDEKFDSYFKHIDHPVHLKKISDSVGQEYIGELVHHVRQEAQRRERALRTQLKIKKRKKTESCLLGRQSERDQDNRHRNINFQQKKQMANKELQS